MLRVLILLLLLLLWRLLNDGSNGVKSFVPGLNFGQLMQKTKDLTSLEPSFNHRNKHRPGLLRNERCLLRRIRPCLSQFNEKLYLDLKILGMTPNYLHCTAARKSYIITLFYTTEHFTLCTEVTLPSSSDHCWATARRQCFVWILFES